MIEFIARSFKELQAADPTLTGDLPGGLHYGTRTDTRTPRPFGLFTVLEISRLSDSGGGQLVSYSLRLKIYGKQRFKSVGWILADFRALLTPFQRLDAIPQRLAEVLAITGAEGSTISEDPEEEYGKDCVVGEMAWTILLNEALQLYGAPT